LIKPILLSANGKSKKALIFDCDNTLWNGILGEDGFNNIDMSHSTPKGIFFHEVQKIANYFSKKGVLIGLCSKNNLADVQNVIDNHTDFIINDNIIIIKKVNWTDKATNLREISSELNIGLDSIIFVDDSSFEINLINSQIPEIETIQVPKALSEYPNLIYDCHSFFYNLSSTIEDSRKNKMYQENIERKSSERKFNNLNDFLKSLDIELNIVKDDISNIPRISQMTQKTNQFNLTTKRYTENEIETFLKSKEYTLYSFSVLDKFGDNGITGLVILKIDNDVVLIDTFLMSCRIIGRKIETAFIDFLLNELKLQGKDLVKANYIKTKKNVQVEKFYNNIGFSVDRCEKENTYYILQLKKFKSQKINFIKLNFNGK
jgi:FkbH-like protein